MNSRARSIFFTLVVLGLGAFLWSQRDELQLPVSRDTPVVRHTDSFRIVQKVKPGGYIGWHKSERDRITASPLQTRQASNYYFVCRDQRTGAERIFLVPERTYNAERVGNILSGGDVRGFQEVQSIEEPALPSSFEFRRREPEL